jgi:hypothetical protein
MALPTRTRNQDLSPSIISLDHELSILAIIGDGFMKSTGLVVIGPECSHAGHSPLVNHLDLLVEFDTVLVPLPTSRLPFILHLLDYFTGQVTLKAGRNNTNELSLAGKVCLLTAL